MLVLLLITLAGRAAVAAPPGVDQLPDPIHLLDGFINAIGGPTAIKSVTAMDATGRIQLPGGRHPGTFRWSVADGHKAAFETTFPGLGRSAFGADGETGWAVVELPGDKQMTTLSIEEVDRRRRRANWFELATTLSNRATELRTVGGVDFDGIRAWELALTRTDGRREQVFIDQQTNLLLGVTTAMDTSPGAPTITVRFGHWQPAGDLVLFRQLDISGGRTRVRLLVDAISFDPLPEEAFTPPANLPTQNTDG